MSEKKFDLCAKSQYLKELLFKLAKGFVYSVTEKLLKQVDSSPMGGPIYAVFSDIFMCKMELDVVVAAKPIFYKRYVDDTYLRRKKWCWQAVWRTKFLLMKI